MSLKYVLLGLIDLTPMSGYDLVKAFDYSMLFYWHATHTQIYRTLKELEKEEWISGEVVYQLENPSKKIFSITGKGKKALTGWLREEPDLPGFKHGFLIRLSFSSELSELELLKQLDIYEEKLRGKLGMLASEEKRAYLNAARSEKERILWDMSVENGVMYYKNEIAWVQKVKKAIGNEGREMPCR